MIFNNKELNGEDHVHDITVHVEIHSNYYLAGQAGGVSLQYSKMYNNL